MDQSTFHKQLVDRYVNNTATEAELEVIDQLIRAGELDNMLMMHMEESWQAEEAVFESVEQVEAEITVRRFKLWPRIAMAAAAITAITLGTWLYYAANAPRHPEFISGYPIANDIAPGGNKATLTLANGKTITLSDAKTGIVIDAGKLTYNDGTLLRGDATEGIKSALMAINTPKGGQYVIILPEGTKVWLNAASSLKFPKTFTGDASRTVELNGEAYFEVSKDKKHPFRVLSAGQQVEVLGTHFNMYAYNDEVNIKTTLLEGSVKINDATILKPNEEALVTNGKVTVSQVNAKEAIAWKNGYFSFQDTPIKEVMTILSRWYNIEVSFTDKVISEGFTGKFSRFRNISEVLRMLEKTGQVRFKIEGRRVIVQ